MKAFSFFRLLNRKIKQYEKAALNSFQSQKNVYIIWINDLPSEEHKYYKENL